MHDETGVNLQPLLATVFQHLSLLDQGWTQLNLTSRLLVHLYVWTPVMLPLWMSFTQMDWHLTLTLVCIRTDIKWSWWERFDQGPLYALKFQIMPCAKTFDNLRMLTNFLLNYPCRSGDVATSGSH